MSGYEWVSGWPADGRPEFVDRFVRCVDSRWEHGFRSEFEYRDLGLTEASGGLLSGQHIRRMPASESRATYEWHCHDTDFQLNYALTGSTRVESIEGGQYTVTPGDAIFEPGLHKVREYDFSRDYGCIQIGSPTERRETIVGRDAPLPPRADTIDPERGSVYSADTPDAYAPDGSGFARRDLGITQATGGRLRLSVVRSRADGGGECSTGAQWLVVLAGSADLEDTPLERFDAIAFGERRPRRIVPSADFAALELHAGR